MSDEIWDLIESVSEGFLTDFFFNSITVNILHPLKLHSGWSCISGKDRFNTKVVISVGWLGKLWSVCVCASFPFGVLVPDHCLKFLLINFLFFLFNVTQSTVRYCRS